MSSSLSDEERALLSVRADEFHAALARGAASDWRPFLAGLPERLRLPVLTELVILDLIHRWEQGQRPEVEEYVARFPELGPADRVPPALVVEECRCRVKAGQRYDIDSYRDRFPAQYPLIQSELTALLVTTIRGPTHGTVPVHAGPAAPLPAALGSAAVAEQYEMVRLLGRGQFGDVWLARKKTSGIEKAIKIVAQTADKAPARRERKALELIKNLRHTYLLATEDFWVSDDRLHIVMELADCTLRDRLEQCKEAGLPGIPETELFGYVREAAEGLDFLHARHVVHRDVKPDNILLLHGHAKVADFGLAWQQEKQLGPMRTFAGTAAYMAPEVWAKEGGPASDLYSLAVSYVELRQGHPPLRRAPMEEMMFAHLDGLHQFDDLIGPRERGVLEQAMARMPEERYPSCLAFVEALAGALGHPVAVRSGAVSVPPPRSSRGSTALPHSSKPGAESRRGTVAGVSSGTVADRPGWSHTGHPQPPPPAWKLVVAGLLTLFLFGVFGLALWLLFWHDGEGPGTEPTDGGQTAGTSNTGTVTTGKGLPTDDNVDPKNMGGKGDPKKEGNAPANGDPKTPEQPKPISPTGAVKAERAKVVTLASGEMVYDSVEVKVGNESVLFRLITGGPKPFYIMESKVWNGLYRAAGFTPATDSDANGPGGPVTGVTLKQAVQFAEKLGGRLPTPEEWDHAAGLQLNLDRSDVTRPGGKPRVHLTRPADTSGDQGGDDVNEFGLRDMAGNGREWTSAKAVCVNPQADPNLVILRGRNYTLSRGLTFDMLRYEQTTPQTQFADRPSPYTSFRVVLPLP
jgi:serine/threonine protein kinase